MGGETGGRFGSRGRGGDGREGRWGRGGCGRGWIEGSSTRSSKLYLFTITVASSGDIL